jgi:hypothetical protein
VLLDYNFNIETVLASDSFSKVNDQLLTLELILKYEDESLRRVNIEMNLEETASFVNQLKAIEKEVVSVGV